MKVRDIMPRDVVSCQKETNVGRAARLMLQGQFGTLPVVDAHGRLAGIITDRDIAMAAATRQRNASHIAVHEAMSQHVRSCFADDDLTAALKQMEEGRCAGCQSWTPAVISPAFCLSMTSSGERWTSQVASRQPSTSTP
jgi:CBS domain-containing protein